ncbi:hypothetical protein SAMN05216392_1824 [Streptococcus equinus]|uniref:PepSY domain-containing protein n=1 Tax=Streptococcus equinus TaxID=1335 RepID=A0A1H1B8X5_STREI|nr:hypothetical protein [Streptococcus equinus]SDQ48340.1 hypothetical protein SAMN05216392_1824 [Streptococcus equinus]
MLKKIVGAIVFLLFLFGMMMFQPMALNKVYHEELNYDILIASNNNIKTEIIKKKMLQVLEKIYDKKFSQKSYTVDISNIENHSNYWMLTVSKEKEKYQLSMDMETQKIITLNAEITGGESEKTGEELDKIATDFWQLSEVKFTSASIEETVKEDEADTLYLVLNDNRETVAEMGLDKATGKIIYYQKDK